jgi:hypothetical protein
MAVAQWTADQFWKQVQWVASQGRTQKARLDQQKLELQSAFSAARRAGDEAKMAALQPLIHRNSELRLRWNTMRGQFNDVVEQARGWLASYGISEPPTLAVLPALVVPALWVVALIAVVALVHEINAGINAVGEGLRKLGPVGATALALTPLLLIVAALMLGPKILARRAA